MFTRCTRYRTSRPLESLIAVTLAFLAVPAMLTSLFSQTESGKTLPAQTDVVNVNEVTVSLAVRKKGKPVLDLKPEDLAITDGGLPVRVSSLRRVTDDNNEHFITLVFDRLDMAASHNAREISAKILKLIPQGKYSFSVLKIEGRLMLYQDFNPDRTALTHAIASATDNDSPDRQNGAELPEKRLMAVARNESAEAVTAKQRASAQVLLAAMLESQRLVQEQHTQPSYSGLLALARTERKLPGRKVVIYFAQGLHTDASSEGLLHSIVESATRSDVSFYSIDANALTAQADQGMVAMMAIGNVKSAAAQAGAAPVSSGTGAAMQPLPQAPAGLAPMVGNQMDRYESADPNANKSPLVDLARKTGGGYLAPGENLKKQFRKMVEDMKSDYEASYVPAIENYDGKFRPIAVKPVRKGLQIGTRAGYFAVPPDTGSAIRPFEAPLLKLLSEAQLPSDIKFHSAVVRLGELQDGNQNAVAVEVPVSELETLDDPNSNLYSLHVSIVAQIKKKDGTLVQHFSEDVPRHGSLDSKGTAQSEFVSMQRHFVAEPGDYIMEAAVLDHNSGKVSAQRANFSILGPTAGPSLSDLTMVQRIDPVPATEIDTEEPLRYGDGIVVADVSGRVPHGAKEISLFFVVHPDPTSQEQPRLEMTVLKSHEAIAQVPLQLRKSTGPASIPYLASIQSGSLPSGDYEIIERLTQGDKSQEQVLTFRINGPELADATSPDAASSNNDDAAVVSALQLRPADAGRHLVITSLAAGTVPPPTDDQLEAVIASARKRALDYSKSLPNFMCVEMTNRSVDQSGNGAWKHRDSIAEMLTYHDSHESRSTLEIDGKRSSLKRGDMNSSWPMSVGEFGALLNLVFSPSSKTEFHWKETGTLGDGTGNVQVLTFRVDHENASLDLSEGNETVGVGFHGLVYIDSTTSGIRRITLEADGLPRTFAMHAASMTVDYDYVAIGGRDYLLPVRSSVGLQRHHKKLELNEIVFRNYRRFSSRTKIKFVQ